MIAVLPLTFYNIVVAKILIDSVVVLRFELLSPAIELKIHVNRLDRTIVLLFKKGDKAMISCPSVVRFTFNYHYVLHQLWA